MDPVGIMQGRLSPPVKGALQAFPLDTWEEEFPLARRAGLACIEWIYEKATAAENPIASDAGIRRIHRLSAEHGIGVQSICADYFMEAPLAREGDASREENARHLCWLVSRAELLGADHIVLPFVDASSLRTGTEIGILTDLFRLLVPALEDAGVALDLESDLPPERVAGILSSVGHPRVRANYDIGNSASLGYDPEHELGLISTWLGSIHVKDRVWKGGSVLLGTGDADFPTCFRLIRAAGFRGPYILQAQRDPSASELDLAIRNRRFVEGYLAGA